MRFLTEQERSTLKELKKKESFEKSLRKAIRMGVNSTTSSIGERTWEEIYIELKEWFLNPKNKYWVIKRELTEDEYDQVWSMLYPEWR